MANEPIVSHLGGVSAYLDAVAHGFSGTREEFGELLANGATYYQRAETAAQNAERDAGTASSAATAAAQNAQTASGAASTATAAAQSASTDAGTASTAAGTASAAAESASGSAASAATSASNAGRFATNADLSAQEAAAILAAAESAIEAKGTEVEAEVDGYIADAQAAIDTLEAQKDTIAQTVASMAQLGTDTTLTTQGMAADAKVTGEKISDAQTAIEQSNNVVYDKEVTASYKNTLSVGSSIGAATHLLDVFIPAWQFYSFKVTVESGSNYCLYLNGTRLVCNLEKNKVYYFQATQDVSYISIDMSSISGGTITCELKLFNYNCDSGVTFLTDRVGQMENGRVQVPYIPLVGFYNAYGAMNYTLLSNEVHTQMIPTADVEDVYLDLKYGNPSSAVWLTYISYDSSKNITGRTNIATTGEGSYSGKFSPPSNAAYIAFQFRTFDDYSFVITKDWELIKDISEVSYLASNTIKTVAHRGDDVVAPQCTAPAYISARKHGHTIMENDLDISEDGHFVMWHDTSLSRLGNLVDINGYLMYTDGTDYYWVDSSTNSVYTWNGTEYVISATPLSGLTRCAGSSYGVNSTNATHGLNLDVLKRIDFGVWKGSKFAGTQILTFEEWVILCKQLGAEIYIDHKLNYTDELLIQAANIVKKYGMAEHASWLGVYGNQILVLRSIIPDARCGTLSHPTAQNIISYAQYNTGRGFFFNGDAKNGMTAETIQLGLNAGFEVEVWYVDVSNVSEEDQFNVIRNAVNCGVTGITLDHYRVDEAFEYLLD